MRNYKNKTTLILSLMSAVAFLKNKKYHSENLFNQNKIPLIIIHLVLIILMMSTFQNVKGQSQQNRYEVNNNKTWTTLGTGAGLFLTGTYLTLQNEPLTTNKIMSLDHQNLPTFDHPAAHRYSTSSKDISDVLQVGSLLLPATLLLNREIRKEYAAIGIMTSELLLINTGLNMLAKNIISRPRPFAYNSEVNFDVKTTRNAKLSFYSGHVANAAALSFFSAQILTDFTDSRTVKIISWTAAASLPAVMGYLRFDAGKHFLSDIVVGYAVGGLLGYFIPVWHRNKSLATNRVDIQPLGMGLRLTYHIR